jgi:hypothetical protein
MTTWHANETLEEALDFFAISAVPTKGFVAESDFRIVICVRNSDWAAVNGGQQLTVDFVYNAKSR